MENSAQLLLEEWRARYESYRAHRGQYLTTMGLAVTGIAVSAGLAFQEGAPVYGRRVMLTLACMIALALVVAHLFARRTIRALGARLRAFSDELDAGDLAGLLSLGLPDRLCRVGVLAGAYME